MKGMLTTKGRLIPKVEGILVLGMLAVAGCGNGATPSTSKSNSGLAVPIQVPDEVGAPMASAAAVLQREGFAIQETYPPTCRSGSFDYVVSESPNVVAEGGTVNLKGTCVTNGASLPTTATTVPRTPMPNVVGMTVFDAESVLNKSGFEVIGNANETCNGGATDYVTSQSPAAGTNAPNGSDATITGSCSSG
jgi:beta-lactam-binding protein with PASTA domain